MARIIASSAGVAQAANQLLAEGTDVTVLSVQKRVGGGSFTTIRKHLTDWETRRLHLADQQRLIPNQVRAASEQFLTEVWSAAHRLASDEYAIASKKASEDSAAQQKRINEAEAEVIRLENVQEQHVAVIADLEAKMRAAELSLAETRALAKRIPEFEEALREAKEEINAARKEIKVLTVESSEKAGENSALRAQIARTQKAAQRPSKG